MDATTKAEWNRQGWISAAWALCFAPLAGIAIIQDNVGMRVCGSIMAFCVVGLGIIACLFWAGADDP